MTFRFQTYHRTLPSDIGTWPVAHRWPNTDSYSYDTQEGSHIWCVHRGSWSYVAAWCNILQPRNLFDPKLCEDMRQNHIPVGKTQCVLVISIEYRSRSGSLKRPREEFDRLNMWASKPPRKIGESFGDIPRVESRNPLWLSSSWPPLDGYRWWISD